MTIEIVPIREDLIDSFHAALDVVCRERVYLAFLEAPPIEADPRVRARQDRQGPSPARSPWRSDRVRAAGAT